MLAQPLQQRLGVRQDLLDRTAHSGRGGAPGPLASSIRSDLRRPWLSATRVTSGYALKAWQLGRRLRSGGFLVAFRLSHSLSRVEQQRSDWCHSLVFHDVISVPVPLPLF